MKILMVVESKHLGNTLTLAKAMAEEGDITITTTANASNYDLNNYDIVGFGSGIYYGKHDKRIMNFAKNLCDKKAYTFVFSTSGGDSFDKNNSALVQVLTSKNKEVLGTFGCLALDKFFILRLTGGINVGRPNAEDIANAKHFMNDVIAKYHELTKTID